MDPDDWYFLVDENLEPLVVELLEAENYRADRIGDDALFQGAQDETDVMPYARERGAVIVTNDWHDFSEYSVSKHDGVLIVFDVEASAWDIATWTMAATRQFGHPDNCTDWYKLERFG